MFMKTDTVKKKIRSQFSTFMHKKVYSALFMMLCWSLNETMRYLDVELGTIYSHVG